MRGVLIFLILSNLVFSQEWLTPRLKKNLLYSGEIPYRTYLVSRTNGGNVRAKPSIAGKKIGKIYMNNKYQILEIVKGDSTWYKIRLKNGVIGYVHSSLGWKRELRYAKAMEKIEQLERFVGKSLGKKGKLRRINRYSASIKAEKNKRDRWGNRGEQSVKGYFKDGEKTDFRWIQDSRIVNVINVSDGKAQIKIPDSNRVYTIPSKVLSKYPKINKQIRKIIVLDKKNQNQGVYRKKNDHWELVSASYVATGHPTRGEDYYETPEGFFLVNNTVKAVLFYDMDKPEEEQDISRSDYGVRFSGGGYIHGIPFNDSERHNYSKLLKSRELRLGTYAYTHKCIRSPEKHAKFLWEFIGWRSQDRGKWNRKPKELVSVIIIE